MIFHYTHDCMYGSFHYRHVLAVLHFNENLQRETRTTKSGEKCYSVTYPKFKLGEEVVREVAVPPTYGKLYYLKLLESTHKICETKQKKY